MAIGERRGTLPFNGISLERYKYEMNRFLSFSNSTISIPIRLACCGFAWNGEQTECVYCAQIIPDIDIRWTYRDVLGLHKPKCPILTNIGLDNVPIRQRGPEDYNPDVAISYITMRATQINNRSSKQGISLLDSMMIQRFLDRGHSVDTIKEAIILHFDENGLFPNGEMLLARLL